MRCALTAVLRKGVLFFEGAGAPSKIYQIALLGAGKGTKLRYDVRTKQYVLSDEQRLEANRLGISEAFARLLFGRGMSAAQIKEYLDPSMDRLTSPFDIDGMAEAAKRVKKAISHKEKILIYGDYDCDGICAISILMLYLKGKADAWYFIPDRNKDGYGISLPTLERILAAKKPSLVITVDCGITAVREVQYLRDRGVDVIVTDHHEPQESVPDCIVVDAKIARKGFCDLCGAGVAWKLVEAIAGRAEANKYLDIAAIATVADVVPLVGDNRIIAYFGLKQLRENPRKGVKMLFDGDNITSQDVMYRLAPRINAAGRLNSAMKVVELFTEDDYFLLKTLAEELGRDNARRQEMCEAAVAEAKTMLRGADFNKTGLITLCSENWEAGILGIAASRLVEEFKRPVVLFALSDGMLRGSARSVPGVNIFQLLSKFSSLYTSFGGHAQAAGVSMRPENFRDFAEQANAEVLRECGTDKFVTVSEPEMELPSDVSYLRFARELEMMEPTGNSNPKPTFLIKSGSLGFDRIGFSQHVKCVGNGLDIMGFSRYADNLTYRTGELELEVSLGVNTFQNVRTAQAIIKSINVAQADISEDDRVCMNLHQLSYEGILPYIRSLSQEQFKAMLSEKFGTAAVFFGTDAYKEACKKYPELADLPVCVAAPDHLDPETCAVICPSENFGFEFYKNVVIADDPLCTGYVRHISTLSQGLYAPDNVSVSMLSVSDARLRAIYRELAARAAKTERYGNMRKLYVAVNGSMKLKEWELLLALRVFDELDLVKIGEKGQLNISKKTVELSNSVTYRNIRHQ